MKVVKFITSHGGVGYSGKGGHYHSLSTIANELSSHYEIEVYSFGNNPSEVLKNKLKKLRLKHVYIKGISDLFKFHKDNDLIESIKSSDIIHCYDKESLIQGARLSRVFSKPLAFTRCGGSNPSTYFPYVPNAVFFSEENCKYFQSNKLTGKNSCVISNRIKKIKPDINRITLLKSHYNIKNEKIVMHIARFTKKYMFAHLQSIDLVNHFRKKGIKCKLLLIGHNIDKDVTENVYSKMGDNDYIVNESKFCNNANELFYAADYVVGQGRVIMEALQFNKTMYIPTKNDDLPIQITDLNANKFIKFNMTGRAVDSGIIQNKNKGLPINSRQIFSDIYSIITAIGKYDEFYKNCIVNKNSITLKDELLMFINKLLKLMSVR
jgi:hypothetical protein